MPGYNPSAIEKKWQHFWSDHKTFATSAPDPSKPKYYVLDMFPYPSGEGLHVGHPLGYIATDIVARYKRANGFNVLHPMGWDAFGLPAEQYAIKMNVHPRQRTADNINRFRLQLQSLGFSYDWSREVDTTDPAYYKWTQWIFLKLYDTWFDESQQKGRPIAELIEEYKSGKRPIPPIENRKSKIENWTDLSPTEQRKILSNSRFAYLHEAPVNWCPALGTVLANEEVIDGKSEVGNFPVERKPMRQWMLRITAYANRLITGLDNLEWSDSLKEMQRNWIGKSEGAEVEFAIDPNASTYMNKEQLDVAGNIIVEMAAHELSKGCSTEFPKQSGSIKVFTTRPDTLFGATYMVVAPEHPVVSKITTADQMKKIEAYQKWSVSRSDRERQEDTTKTGEFTGAYAINPVSKASIPIWVSDYVLMNYGTGAIMAVPAHDTRDHEFAKKFNLPIIQVVAPQKAGDGIAGPPLDVQADPFTEEGLAVNSPWIENLPTQTAKSKMLDLLEERKIGKRQINYKIRDWLFSRQRYWGEPFPLIHLADGSIVRLADAELPVELPELADFKPTGTIDPPLSKATDWLNVHVLLETQKTGPGIESLGSEVARIVPPGTPGSQPARRELNTMPQWAGSCWYYLRYTDPKNPKAFVDPQIEKYWLGSPSIENRNSKIENPPTGGGGVDLYVGGVEHAVLHLLYSRFWHKVLFDHRLVSCDEPFRKLVNQGLMQGEDGQKMSKSRGNVVNPDDIIKEYGTDPLRMFEMFMGPLEQGKPWSTAGVEGLYRFLQRVWRNLFDESDNPKLAPDNSDEALQRPLHRLIKKVTDDIDRLSFNTAIAAMMEFNNTLAKSTGASRATALTLLRLLEPFAPHFAEEAHSRLTGSTTSITALPWPTFDPALLIDSTIELPIQINGKLRARITIPADADEPTVLATALANEDVHKFLAGIEPKKKIYIKGRMVNLVV